MIPVALRPPQPSPSALAPPSSSPSDTTATLVQPPQLRPSTAADKALLNDPKFRKHSQAVDKCLVSFDNINDWSDCISFLAKLLKCLQSYPQFQVIPHKLTVAKRLSQCLNPALPTGVHQRALDVYTHILTTIGPENLRRDLPAWSSGLFPFFQYAATSVKPIVLGIYERFYLPLQESLRPATKAFILALLPGLEEETGEFFEKVAALLDRVSGTVSPAFFFQNIWLVLITAPNSRIPALNYLSKRMPKMLSHDSVVHIVGQDIGLMIRGFAAALEDPQILVQRGILDLLTTTLKLDSGAFKSTRRDDQILLFRAVSGVVLRKDLSLSRRLYTWLLGPTETSESQVEYLKEHGLELLRAALKADMDAQTVDTVDRQRPFKIFVSLLDKWEIGAPLTEVLVLDAFAALQTSLRPNDDHDELLMTGNMLFEIIDPLLLWKQMFISVREAILGDGNLEVIKLARFIVRTFRLHDEEVQKLHAPFVAFGILDLVEASSRNGRLPATASLLACAIDFTADLLEEISSTFFESSNASCEAPIEHLGLTLANELYDTDAKNPITSDREGHEILASGFLAALRLAETCVNSLKESGGTIPDDSTAKLLASTLSVIDTFSDATTHSSDDLRLPWKPTPWIDAFLRCLTSFPAHPGAFSLHSDLIRLVLTVTRTPCLRPVLETDPKDLVETLASKLLDYLQPTFAPCFVEAIQLIWGVEELSGHRVIESMISARLISLDPVVRLPAFEAFGNLWRFTDDAQLPGLVLTAPMYIMLDSLKSEDLGTRRAGEAWMRCSLKSYLRILDPLLLSLLDPAIRQSLRTVEVRGLELPILVYESTFDQARIHHILDDLLNLSRFGGQGFIRIAKGSFLKHTLDPALRERVRAGDLETYTYLDGLVAILVRFLRAEPSPTLVPSMAPLNFHIHSAVSELLQLLISRGESDITNFQAIESTLTSRLYLCVHRCELDLQNKLLHVLHSVVHVVAGKRSHKRTTSINEKQVGDAQPSTNLSGDAMFVRVVSDAISTQNNNAVIHHWVDFLLMTIPQFRNSIHTVVFPLVDCLIARLRSLVVELEATYSPTSTTTASTGATDAEYTVLMNALERLLLMGITESHTSALDDDLKSTDRSMTDSPAGGASNSGGGLLAYMWNSELEQAGTPTDEPGKQPKQASLGRLRDSVNLLLYSWDVTSSLESHGGEEQGTSRDYFTSRIKARARKALEKFFKAAPTDVVEIIVCAWGRLHFNEFGLETDRKERLFLALDILAPSPQSIVAMVCDKLAPRSTGAPEKSKGPVVASAEVLFAFLEIYLDRMEGPSAVQAWSVCFTFVREFLSNISTSRPYIFSCLRCFTTLSEKVSRTNALEDRRMRRDLQEIFIRLTDASITLAGKAVEQGGWLRRAVVNESPANADTDSLNSDKGKGESDDPEDDKRPVLLSNQARDITEFLALRVLPDFRRFLIDSDKIVAVCSNMVYYIVSPAFKTRSRTFEIDSSVFELLAEMVRNPATVKAWKTPISDAFADNRFFNAPPSAHPKWKPLIQALMSSDKERFVDLTAKISTVTSANIFTNRELESVARTLSLRRLTYTIFAGEKDRFLTQLPIIQEKLVDLLRSSVGDMVHAEVYLCLRVLFCRFGNQHLSGFWPVILTELLRLFESLVDRAIPDGSDLLQLVSSACKFLDLTLVLQTEEFQIHEWMFVTDTVDAIYPPDGWIPQAIMDRLGEILLNPHQALDASAIAIFQPPTISPEIASSFQRKPLLAPGRIKAVSELVPFFGGVSLAAYETVYNSAARIDFEAVERGLGREIFEGPEL